MPVAIYLMQPDIVLYVEDLTATVEAFRDLYFEAEGFETVIRLKDKKPYKINRANIAFVHLITEEEVAEEEKKAEERRKVMRQRLQSEGRLPLSQWIDISKRGRLPT